MQVVHRLALATVVFSSVAGAQQPTVEELLRRPPPTRSLSAEEAQRLTQLVVTLLDEKAGWGDRVMALNELVQKVHHVACVPPLRFVALDEGEDANLRIHAARGMLRLGPAALLGDVLPLLSSKDSRVRLGAWEILVGQYPPGREFGYDVDPRKSPQDNAEAIRRWEKWWEENKATFKIKLDPLRIIP